MIFSKIHEVAEVNPRAKGLALKDNDPVSFIPMAAISEQTRSVVAPEVRSYREVAKGYTYFEEGDVIIAKITPCFENGKIALAERLPHPIAFGSTEYHVVRAGKNVHNRYLFYLLQSPNVLAAGAARMKGAAGQKRVPAEFLKDLEIPVPPLAEQKRIAAILDAADELRAKRRESLAQLDTLPQSTFLDLFGDPVTNPKGWENCVLGDVVFSATDGPHVSPKYADKGIPFLSTRHIKPGKIVWEDLKYIDSAEADRQWRKCRPEFGDILYTKGGTTGLAARVDTHEPFAVWVHVALLKTDVSKVEPEWLEAMLNSNYCYTQSQRYTHGIANRDLGLKRMLTIEMFLPPRERQKEFVEFRHSLEHQQGLYREQLTELDTLFASLQSRAFRGEL